jgi:hypothetical protein
MKGRSQGYAPVPASTRPAAPRARRQARERRPWLAAIRGAATIGGPLVLIGVLAWPMLFTNSGLGGDWQHYLWYVWHQGLNIRSNHVPSPFLNTPYSVFYPEYEFYGGTIYALAGAVPAILDASPIKTYVFTFILGFMAAYGGWYWIGRTAGLGRWLAHAPALVFITSACYLTLVYGQGNWPEFIAVSMMPLIAAAALSILHAERLRPAPAIALAVSATIFFGSHNITMLWGSTVLAITGALMAACIPDVRRKVKARNLARLACIVIPAGLINAWFLLPAIAYASHTKIGSEYGVAYETLHRTMGLVSFDRLFTLSRASTVSEDPDYVLALPTLVIAWALVSLVIVLWSVRRGAWARALAILGAITGALIVLMTHVGLLLALPKPYTILQFSYRMESYVLMGVSATVLAILVMTQSGSRRLRLYAWTLAPVLAVSAVGAIQQVNAYPRTEVPREETLTSSGEVFAEAYDDYGYIPLPLIGGKKLLSLRIAPAEIHDNRLSVQVRAYPGQLVYTNIGGGPNLLHVTGARIVGRDARYHLVLAMEPGGAARAGESGAAPRTERLTIGPLESAPVVLGRLLSLGGAIVLALELAWLVVRRRRERRRETPDAVKPAV